MTNDQKENLFVLIKSLSKSEKRQFKLFVGRMDSNSDSKFLILFNLLDKMVVYDEKLIFKKDFVSKQQLSNLKAHLYKHGASTCSLVSSCISKMFIFVAY